VVLKLLMMDGVSLRNMQSANFRINTYENVHLVGLFIQLIQMHGQYNIISISLVFRLAVWLWDCYTY
jgi:hypothetical protein